MSGHRAKARRRHAEALLRAAEVRIDTSKDAELQALEGPAWSVTESDIQEALRIVRRTGLVEKFTPELQGERGRKRSHCTFEGLLVALVVNVVILGRSPFLSDATVTLYECMTPKWREYFSANYPVRTVKDRRAATKAVERLWKKFRLLLDAERMPTGPRRTEAEMARVIRDIPPELAEKMDAALLYAMNRIVGATVAVLMEKLPKPQGWLYGLDATLMISRARPGRKKSARWTKLYSADPQAGWYIRKKTNYEDSPNTTASGGPSHRAGGDRTKAVIEWGYEIHIVGLAPDPYSQFRDVPDLALGITIDRPGFSPNDNGIKALDATAEMGMPAGILGFDAAYITEGLLNHARELGFGVLFDPKAQQADTVVEYLGGKVVGGGMVCPGVQETLLRINADYHQKKITKEAMYARGEELDAFRPRIKETLPNGKLVLGCPATAAPGRAPTCCCPLKPKSFDFDDLPKVPNPPGVKGSINEAITPGKLCSQKTITVDPKELYRHQHFPHRSPEWRAAYAAVRNAIERNHSQSKAGYGAALGVTDSQRSDGQGQRRAHGRAAARRPQPEACALVVAERRAR